VDHEAAGGGIGGQVFDFLKKKPEPEKRISDADRSWIDMEWSTMSMMKSFFESNEIFTMFAGAAFALHQDTLRAYAIDMRKTDDVLLGAAMTRCGRARSATYRRAWD
jgi:hypothetical protein